MTIDDQIRDVKLQYDINREAAKISSLSSGKIHKYLYLTGKDILPSSNQQIIEQARFIYSPLGKAFNKQIKTIEDQGEKQVKALNTLKSDNNNNNNKLTIENIIPKIVFASDEAENKISKISEIEDTIDREKLLYKASENAYDFIKFRTIRIFGRDIYEGKITLEETDEDQSEIKYFSERTKPRTDKKKEEKEIAIDNFYKFYNTREMVLNGFKSKIFLTKSTGTGILNTDHFKLKY